MSVAYYIVLDTEEQGFDTFVNGKAVAHAADELDALCSQNGLQTLDSFMGQSMDEFADMLGEGDDDDDEEGEDESGESLESDERGVRGDEKWFAPSDGLTAINAIIAAIERNPSALSDPDAVLEDLEEYKAVLERAQAIEAQWLLALDI